MNTWRRWFPPAAAADVTMSGGGPLVWAAAADTTALTAPAPGRMVRTFGRKGSGRGQFNTPCGVAVTDAGDIVVADTENCRIQIFHSDGRPKLQIGQKGSRPHQLNHPMCVALVRSSKSQHIAVTDSVNACIKVFRQDGSFVARYSDCAVFAFPYGLAASNARHLVVTDLCKHAVIVLQPSGCLLRQFGELGDGDSELDHPYFVAVNDDHQIIVSDSGNSAIKIFSFEGCIQRKFSLDDFRLLDEHFVLLQGLVVDSVGNIVVVGNSTVYVCAAARDGRLWEVVLPADGLHAPRGLAHAPHAGQLVVTQAGMDSQHEVSIFSYHQEDFRALKSGPTVSTSRGSRAAGGPESGGGGGKRKASHQRPSSTASSLESPAADMPMSPET